MKHNSRITTNVWKLIRGLQLEESTIDVIVAKNQIGIPPIKKTKKKYVNLQMQLKNLCKDLLVNRKGLEEFIYSVGKIIRFGDE